jgi:hypothetical protein
MRIELETTKEDFVNKGNQSADDQTAGIPTYNEEIGIASVVLQTRQCADGAIDDDENSNAIKINT